MNIQRIQKGRYLILYGIIVLLVFYNAGCSEMRNSADVDANRCGALECHPATLLQKRTPETGKHSAHLARGFDCEYCHYNYLDNRNHKNGKLDVNGSAVIVYFNSAASRTDISTYWDNGSSTCNNLKCHGTLNWYASSTASCIDCHASGTSIDPLLTGAHSRHVSDAAYACEECHKDYRTNSLHMNGEIDNPSGSSDMIKFNSAVNPSGSYTAFSKTCSGLVCHGSALTSQAQGTDLSPEWDNPSTGDCGTCHKTGGALAQGSHSQHNLVFNNDCDRCHEDGVAEAGHHTSGAMTVDGTVSYALCSTCHTGGSPVWGSSGSVTCGDCHGYPPATGAHSRHVTDKGYSCSECHSGRGSGTQYHYDGIAEVNFNSLRNPSGSYSDVTQTCDTLVCHGGSIIPAAQGTDISPEWGDSLSGACGTCHNADSSGTYILSSGSHASHFDSVRGPGITDTECNTCHSGESASTHADGSIDFNDSNDFSSTTACDTCHSPGGSYDGVNDSEVGAKNVWSGGVYAGDALAGGKEKWCVTCHDDSPSVIDTNPAPNIAGNESASFNYGTGYGYYKTGHGLPSAKTYPASGGVIFGAGIDCDACHDFSLTHIDGVSRTFDCSDGCNSAEYRQSYRLDLVSSADPMEIPRTSTSPSIIDSSFALCFSCHTSTLFTDSGSLQTNFRNPASATPNLHYYHINNYNQRYRADWTDYDTLGVNSRMTCVTCHNVHGTTRLSMVRDGKLINSEPGVEIYYDNNLIASPPYSITLIDSTGWNWIRSSADNLCSNCHGGGFITIDRTPNWSGEMPVLTWTLETDYITKGAFPVNVGTGQASVFRVKYTDLQNNAPGTIELWIDLNDDGDYNDAGEKNAMSEADGGDTDYTDGKIYTLTFSVNYPAGATDGYINYRFYADDGTNTATGTATEDKSIRVDENNAHDVPSEYSTIQAAIDDTDNDNITTVLVADGTYTENINFGGRDITVKSVNGYSVTIIDGNAADTVVTFNSGETSGAVLDGFTIRNGGSVNRGAGIFMSGSSPVIKNCNISSNYSTQHGAGIYMSGSSPVIDNCIFNNNRGDLDGVIYALSSSVPTITNSTFTNNTVRYGAGIYIKDAGGTVTIDNCDINNNSAVIGTGGVGGGIYVNNSTVSITGVSITGNTAYQYGGGIYIVNSSSVTVGGNSVINGNSTSALDGGGIYVDGSALNITGGTVNNNIGRNGCGISLRNGATAVITGVTIQGNSNTIVTNGSGGAIIINGSTATIEKAVITGNSNLQYGGGLYLVNTTSLVTITNSIIAGNRAEYFSYSEGGGFSLDNSSLTLMNCTVADNVSQRNGSAVRILNSSVLTAANTIFDGNYANTSGNEIQGSNSTLNMDYSIYSTTLDSVGTNNIGTNMLSTPPSFIDAANGDYYLNTGSSGIDAGTSAGAPSDDLDGNSRGLDGDGFGTGTGDGSDYDMGAYEFVP